jgi:hypothetical protein
MKIVLNKTILIITAIISMLFLIIYYIFFKKTIKEASRLKDVKIISKESSIYGHPRNPSMLGDKIIQHRSWNSSTDNTTTIIEKDGTEIPLHVEFADKGNTEIFQVKKIENGRLIEKGKYITFNAKRGTMFKVGICETVGDRSGCLLKLIDYPEGDKYSSTLEYDLVYLPTMQDNSKMIFIKSFEPFELIEVNMNYKNGNWIPGRRLHSFEGSTSAEARIPKIHNKKSFKLLDLKGNVHAIEITKQIEKHSFGRIWLTVGYYTKSDHVFILIVQNKQTNLISIHRISKIFNLTDNKDDSVLTSSLQVLNDDIQIGFGVNEKSSMMKFYKLNQVISEFLN